MERCPRKVVVDASVVAKWLLPEKLTEKALRVRDAHANGDIELTAPDLLIYEVANVLRYRSDVNEEVLGEYVQALHDFGMELEVPGPREILRAAAEARRRDLSVYDGSYLALAKKHATVVLTDDAKLHGSGEGRDTLLLRDMGKEWDL